MMSVVHPPVHRPQQFPCITFHKPLGGLSTLRFLGIQSEMPYRIASTGAPRHGISLLDQTKLPGHRYMLL